MQNYLNNKRRYGLIPDRGLQNTITEIPNDNEYVLIIRFALNVFDNSFNVNNGTFTKYVRLGNDFPTQLV